MRSPVSVSLGSLMQYIFLAGVGVFLAGAPLLSVVMPNSSIAFQRSETSPATTEKLESLAYPDASLECADHRAKGVYILSREPLVVYIEGFVGEEEAQEIVKLSEPHFTPATVWTAGHETLNPLIRHSEKAPLPRSHLVQCIEERARRFQGWRPHTFIEKLWSQRYGVGGHYTYHYDWSSATRSSGRVSSFMVYLEANCTGGGTHFPRLGKPVGKEWCSFIECDGLQSEEETMEKGTMESEGYARVKDGIVFKAITGNAIYWENMRADGTGYLESWHAGLPVRSGVKIGLNIWSFYQDGHVPEADRANPE
ncbi:hypothetical protein T440DRAFT_464740 [Plenodomus tracheiphilus IPT5]|uniref:Prolyl 4-hydroxylase alpha subunit domain-containing protein n=1 Tax=Plenodomus tracheiphilus IPT5 TaxID=1408161 RepID=A0A6A7BGQ6_9PLEO|nr:hypothetical protein T440DRAFT_464740 [Plenodomus tracheiphilus IPT5]